MELNLHELLNPKMGVYDPALRFAFTNITDSEFVSYWGGRPIKVASGKTVELQHHLAAKMTKEMVDKIMTGDAKADEVKYYENNPNTAPNAYRSPKGISLGIPEQRIPWENKICRLLGADEESPETVTLRAQLREELLSNANGDARSDAAAASSPAIPASLEEFADLTAPKKEQERKPIRVKEM